MMRINQCCKIQDYILYIFFRTTQLQAPYQDFFFFLKRAPERQKRSYCTLLFINRRPPVHVEAFVCRQKRMQRQQIIPLQYITQQTQNSLMCWQQLITYLTPCFCRTSHQTCIKRNITVFFYFLVIVFFVFLQNDPIFS